MLIPLYHGVHLTTEKGYREILKDGFIRPHERIDDKSVTASVSARKYAMPVNSEYVYFSPYSINAIVEISQDTLRYGFVFDLLYLIFKLDGLLGKDGLIPYMRVFQQCVADVYDLSKIRQPMAIVGGNHLNVITNMLWGALYNDYPAVEGQENVEALYKERMEDYTPEKMYMRGVEAFMSFPNATVTDEVLVKKPVPIKYCYSVIKNGTPQVNEEYFHDEI